MILTLYIFFPSNDIDFILFCSSIDIQYVDNISGWWRPTSSSHTRWSKCGHLTKSGQGLFLDPPLCIMTSSNDVTQTYMGHWPRGGLEGGRGQNVSCQF